MLPRLVGSLVVNVSDQNVPPVADAGTGSDVLVGSNVALNAEGSLDENRDKLSYDWSVVSAPEGSNAAVANADLPGVVSKLGGSSYYLFFAGCMFVWAIFYIPMAMWFKEETFIQDEEDAA